MSTKRAVSPSLRPSLPDYLDEIDLSILHFLQSNARASNEEVGRIVGLSPSAASRRISALERAGVITGYKATINDHAVGAGVTVFVRVTLEKQSAPVLQSFENSVKRCQSILSCHLMAGDYDYMLQVKIGSIGEYEELHKNVLSRFPGVRRLESNFAVREVSR